MSTHAVILLPLGLASAAYGNHKALQFGRT